MSLQLYAMTCGWLDGPLGLFLAGETGRLRVPVPSYLIVHPKGRVLFDTGLHVETQSDAKGRLGEAGAADGSVVCLPTFGHTPGHQSLRVRLDSGDVVLAADSCYLRRTLEDFHLPTVRSDPEAMLDSLRFLRKLQERGARILFGHDPELWADLPQAPASLG